MISGSIHATRRLKGIQKTYPTSLKDRKFDNPIWSFEHLSDILVPSEAGS